MTSKERILFKALIGTGLLFLMAIVILVGFALSKDKTKEESPQKVVAVQSKASQETVSIKEAESLMEAFWKKIAPVEVGPAHRAIEGPLLVHFTGPGSYPFSDFENIARPLLETYFESWQVQMAQAVFEERQLPLDADLIEEMLLSVGMEDKVHFMLLYEKIFLKSKGILIGDEE